MRRRLFANRDLRIEFIETSVCSVLCASLTALHLIFIERSIHTYIHPYIYVYIYTRIHASRAFFSIEEEKKFRIRYRSRFVIVSARTVLVIGGGGGGEGKEEREDEFAPRITFSRSAPSQLPPRPIGGELKLGCRKGWRLKLKLS